MVQRGVMVRQGAMPGLYVGSEVLNGFHVASRRSTGLRWCSAGLLLTESRVGGTGRGGWTHQVRDPLSVLRVTSERDGCVCEVHV